MTVRYSHPVPEHKANGVTKLSERFDGFKAQSANQSAVVSPELKEAINAVLPLSLVQNRKVFLMWMGRGLKIVSDVKRLNVARDGIEPPTRGFSVLTGTWTMCHQRSSTE